MFTRVAQSTQWQRPSALGGYLRCRHRDRRQTQIIISCITALAAIGASREAHAAGAAYQVDTVEISEPDSCKVESCVSWASNRDFSATTSPACATEIVRPVEFSMQLNRSRSDGE